LELEIMRRFARASSIISLAVCASSRAITLYNFDTNSTTGNPSSHASAPTGTFANSGWQYQGMIPEGIPSSGTAIGPHTFVTAAHTNPTNGTIITYNGGTYTVTGSTLSSNREVAFVTVSGTLPFWAPVYNNTVSDGSIQNQTLVDMGRGTQRGDPITVSTVNPGDPNGGTLRGWVWGPLDSVQRWGTNTVSGTYTDPSTHFEYLTYTFDRNGLTDEATVSGGDSGGGVFIKSATDGVWKFAGVNSSVSPSSFRYDPNTATTPVDPLPSSAFDYSDLYLQSTTGQYFKAQDYFPGQNPIPQTAYISNLTDVGSAIFAPYVPHMGDVNCDGKVNALDFSAIATHFGVSSGAVWLQGDLNYDGKVNASDFTLFSQNFGYSGVVPGLAVAGADPFGIGVPEPTSLAALSLVAFAFRRRRR
jgi:hypothetical protein